MLEKILSNTFFIGFWFLVCCQNKTKPEVFQQMRTKYQDLKIDDSNYFLKDFGWSDNSIKMSGKNYQKLKCSPDSYFFIGGYCRMQNGSLLLIPFDYKNATGFNEDTLFSFNVPEQASWNARFDNDRKMSSGDSIVFTGKTLAQNDTLFNFTLHPFYFYPASGNKHYQAHRFDVEVSKSRGIIRVFTIIGNRDTLYEATLLPQEKFINRMGNKLII
ncbi:hypothetical protein D3H65_05350 [Paraflavitalea soli]|uniref:Uncharacterized protein n=1 Tax=Paraflavitalea soli TaxID=2315862 RepID=A0A3B7MK79_9BACT|nr:hypothetical protein [Paraflavitalea soli]AXY73436.1 hypothetical protein D3H65_05350 [Paraflavitalea soli]